MESFKYTWIELDIVRRKDDFRPESYSPKNYDFKDLKVLGKVDTKGNWLIRKELCLKNVYTSLSAVIDESRAPLNKSLVTFKPTKVKQLVIEPDEREWKNEWTELRKQPELFSYAP